MRFGSQRGGSGQAQSAEFCSDCAVGLWCAVKRRVKTRASRSPLSAERENPGLRAALDDAAWRASIGAATPVVEKTGNELQTTMFQLSLNLNVACEHTRAQDDVVSE